MTAAQRKPILLLLAVMLMIGLFVFRDYGLAWDEPYFYSYADALGYAYTPANWLRPDFDLNNSYGASGEDHKTRGPAYLLLARGLVYGVQALGVDAAAAWHLINFVCLQLGVYFLYRLALRWMSPPAALAAAALFATQPLLWGHGFINPKDPPFLTFFTAAVCLGFEMADALVEGRPRAWLQIAVAGVVLGLATSIRVLGPLAGLLAGLYLVARLGPRSWRALGLYAALAILVMFLSWPYLWEAPLTNFTGVFRLMSDNPTTLSVLFGGQVYRAGDLPLRYLPVMLVTTLTEPVWILFGLGLAVAATRYRRGAFRPAQALALGLVLAWFGLLVAYVLLRRPAMYDGFRHFLFILPPVFVFSGLALDFLFERVGARQPAQARWLQAGWVLLLALPGIVALVLLHPYEYTYYNSFIGGTDGAFRQYETDYWLTCYKEAVGQLAGRSNEPLRLYVHREAYIAGVYAGPQVQVVELRGAQAQVRSGDYVLVNTRTNEDRRVFDEAPTVLEVRRGDAIFCIVRRIP